MDRDLSESSGSWVIDPAHVLVAIEADLGRDPQLTCVILGSALLDVLELPSGTPPARVVHRKPSSTRKKNGASTKYR